MELINSSIKTDPLNKLSNKKNKYTYTIAIRRKS
jgi:hypothetical protein